MNPRPALAGLAVSGTVLAAVVAWMATRPPANGGAGAGTESAAVAGAPGPKPVAGDRKPSVAATWSFDWTQVATNDLRHYIRNLRGVKCPEQTVRDIIIAEVDHEFAPREAPFKVSGDAVLIPENETSAQRRARKKADYQRRRNLRLVEKEKAAVIRDLLGIDIPLEPLRGWHNRNYERMESAINGVPAGKRERVRETMEAYWELSDTLNDERDVPSNGRDGEFIERYKENNERRRLGLSQVLTPDELELFDMRASSVADRLRTQLGEMQPSEAEFREIYRLRRDVEEPFGGTMTVSDVSNYQQDPEAENRYRQRLEATLSPERLAQMDQVQSEGYQNLARLRDRFDLPAETVDKAYELLRQGTTVTEPAETIENGQVVQRVVTRSTGRPTEEQLNQLRAMLGDRAFMVFQAMVPDDRPPVQAAVPLQLVPPARP